MYKIFIDTNIFLDFYRYNNNENILEVKKEFSKYKKHFINTEQSHDEFYRNRERTINEFIETLKSQINPTFESNFIYNFEGFDRYINSIKRANQEINKMIEKCKELILDSQKDPVCNIYSIFNSKMFPRTEDIVDKAIKRKYIGNPPTSNKYTCCDEIIWETILQQCEDDLIIVTRDKTFKENLNFLKTEFNNKTKKELKTVDSISNAIRLLGDVPSSELENIENSIQVEKDIQNSIEDNSSWIAIIYNSLNNLGGQACLNDIYKEAHKLISEKYPEKSSNKNIEATIRGMLQRFCSSSSAYTNRIDLFENIDTGIWAIKKDKD